MTETKTPSRTRRMVAMLVAVGLVLGALVGFNLFKNHMISSSMANSPIPSATVTALRVEYQEWQPQLAAVGSLRALRGVDVTTEVAGLVRRLEFKSGDTVAAGQVLARLNDTADVARLHALEAQAGLAATVYERDHAQLAVQAVSRAQVDADAADLKAKRAQVAEQAALVAKKQIRAPFAGKVGISLVNPGQYLNTGDRLVTLQQIDALLADFWLPQRELAQLATGREVVLAVDAYKDRRFTGRVTSINPVVDAGTRNVEIEASVPNPDHLLLPGMFARVTLNAGPAVRYLTLPQTAIAYNPFGDIVYLAQASGHHGLEAHQVFVTTGLRRGDQVAILTGIAPGALVVTSGQGKLKNGTPIVIDNAVQPADSPNPHPQEQ